MRHCMEIYVGVDEHKFIFASVHTNANHLNVTKPEELIKNNLLRIY